MMYNFTKRPFPAAGSDEERADLNAVIYQFHNRRNPEYIQQAMDEDVIGVFEAYLQTCGHKMNREYYEEVLKELIPIIMELKNEYNRERPQQTAKRLGVKLQFDNMPSSDCPSYPSGHSMQAFVTAGMLSEEFPDQKDALLQLAEMVAQSRIDRGVHFPTDIAFGRKLAFELLNQLSDLPLVEFSDE